MDTIRHARDGAVRTPATMRADVIDTPEQTPPNESDPVAGRRQRRAVDHAAL